MASLTITAPDGKTLTVTIPPGTDPSQYDAMVNEVIQDYSIKPEGSGTALAGGMNAVGKGLDLSKKLGTMVEAGGAGLSDLVAGGLQNINPMATSPAPSLSDTANQASTDVTNVENGVAPTSTAGQVGKTIGSFFTPNQIALQAVGGAAAPTIAESIGNTAAPVVKGLVNAFPKISSAIGAEPEAISALASNPSAVAGAKDITQTAQDVAGTVQGLRQSGMDIASAGKAALSDTTPVVGLKDSLMNYAATLANGPAADEADQAAADYVTKFAKSLDLNPSESDIGDIINDLDNKINAKYNQANPSPLNDAKMGISRTLKQALQAQNPTYAKAMAQASGTFEPAGTLEKSLGVKGGNPSDRTVNALRNRSTPEAIATQKALANNLPGTSDTIANAVAKDALQKSLLGKLGLFLAPKVGTAISGGLQTLPALGNAAAQTVQGLTNGQ